MLAYGMVLGVAVLFAVIALGTLWVECQPPETTREIEICRRRDAFTVLQEPVTAQTPRSTRARPRGRSEPHRVRVVERG